MNHSKYFESPLDYQLEADYEEQCKSYELLKKISAHDGTFDFYYNFIIEHPEYATKEVEEKLKEWADEINETVFNAEYI